MQGVRHAGPRIVSYYYNSISGVERLQAAHSGRHLEILPVTPSLLSGQALSAAKGLARLPQRSFAALRMTGRPPLKPAQTVFAEMGYDEATTNHIAAQAAISPGSLYQFFSNKEEIAQALAARYTAELQRVYGSVFSVEAASLPPGRGG